MRSKFFLLIVLTLLGVSCEDDEPILSLQDQLALDIKKIDAHLAANNIVAQKDTTGVRYVIHFRGAGGEFPKSNSCIIADYVGKLLSNNTIFDEGEVYKISLLNLVAGWQIGVPYMQVGDSATLYIPSGYGYGSREQTKIPKNSNLIFGIKLNAIGKVEFNPANGANACYFEPLE